MIAKVNKQDKRMIARRDNIISSEADNNDLYYTNIIYMYMKPTVI